MKTKLLRRLGAILMVLVMTAAFMPQLGGYVAYAGGGTDLDGIIDGLNSDGTASVGRTLTVKFADVDDKYGGIFKTAFENGEVKAGWNLSDDGFKNDESVSGDYSDGVFSYTVKTADEGKYIRFETSGEDSTFNNQTSPYEIVAARPTAADYLVRTNIKAYNGPFTLIGHSTSSTFKSVDIFRVSDDKHIKSVPNTSGKSDFSIDFTDEDLAALVPDDYTIKGTLNDSENTVLKMSFYNASSDTLHPQNFTAPITEKITIKRNSDYFSVGPNYICFRPYFTVPKVEYTSEMLYGYVWIRLYDTKAKKWGDVYGPFDSYQIAKTGYFTGNKSSGGTKIKPNRKYQVVAFYAKEMGHGWEIGPNSNTVTITTGKKAAPAVKSVTAKAVKTRKVKLIQHAHWDVSGKWIPYKESYTWATTYKVTVKLKKKPGTKGIYIGSKKVKGNKTTYTATFEESGKLKGKTIKVAICSYNDNTLGAYSKEVKKKVKIR